MGSTIKTPPAVKQLRFVTATTLFDGHDASINIFRRLLQGAGAEVIHLAHSRSADEIVQTAIQEEAHAIAASSYQGGHVEFFKYMRDLLVQSGAGHVRIFGGGGGVITPEEIRELEEYGITRIYSPEDGQKLGLEGIIADMMERSGRAEIPPLPEDWQARLKKNDSVVIARLISLAESGLKEEIAASLRAPGRGNAPVIGVTGTGGSGKSTLEDEFVRRFLALYPEKNIALLAVDPSKKKTGGALLGDRIRMNALQFDRVYMRSIATRKSEGSLPSGLHDMIAVLRAASFDLIIIETPGIGQGDAGISSHSDFSIYVMTSDYGAPSQLEKIDMLDYADMIVINKFDHRNSPDALRDVRKQYRRTRNDFSTADEALPVFGTMASNYYDRGLDVFFAAVIDRLLEKGLADWPPAVSARHAAGGTAPQGIIPAERFNYLSEISTAVRRYHAQTDETATLMREMDAADTLCSSADPQLRKTGERLAAETAGKLDPEIASMLAQWEETRRAYGKDALSTEIRGREIITSLKVTSLSGLNIPLVALPRYDSRADLIKWLRRENLPGHFPFTSGVFPFRRTDEDPKRQFAGEGSPGRTNRRFHYLTRNDTAKRLSTAFDSVTLYGQDPSTVPDVFGKIGESGVSICTLEDMKELYAGFDLCDVNTSVSMTINGPAPIMLAFFFNTAIDRAAERFAAEHGHEPSVAELERIQREVLRTVRGTVQADILKEDQGQNSCIFSTNFALRMMGDVQSYFIDNAVRNFYSVSISGYHIAEAGAAPVTQLAFTLANAFTYVEYYLSRGMKIDDFAPNLSFFFSSGMEPEYNVLIRVARRIWAVAMKQRYGAGAQSQRLKCHIQTSGRSLHAQEMQFNDVRTTLQALMALNDNCNSLHTNSYDEAITTPTEESVRRAMAIQLIIGKEYGIFKNQNGLQGSFIIEQLTDMVEEAVLEEFDRISRRGGVLGAMESYYQRGRIQEESLAYEHKKHSGEYPIIGVNTFRNSATLGEDYVRPEIPLTRASFDEKMSRIDALRDFHRRHAQSAPAALARLKEVADTGANIFAELMNTARVASLGQITQALYESGGKYRRTM
ncbi:MAG TPA: fused isobutyryl-CoA mutase/GTPase IcmF [Spirochaetota bacterium]|nr:fused isobutyryl-CoA mutase/GTPase IcmF [Spirochaetota bacterium]